MAEHSIGKITQIIGAVLDIKFADEIFWINDAIRITRKTAQHSLLKLLQHLSDDTVTIFHGTY